MTNGGEECATRNETIFRDKEQKRCLIIADNSQKNEFIGFGMSTGTLPSAKTPQKLHLVSFGVAFNLVSSLCLSFT
jgi:hypothetical protein